jgi:hypothetical protein
MEILLSPFAGLLLLFISRCSIKTGFYCRLGEAVKPFFWELPAGPTPLKRGAGL